MIPDFTQQQLAELKIDDKKPLIICDVDEVIVHFTHALEGYLAPRRLWLDTTSFALNGNIRHAGSNDALDTQAIAQLIDDFFHAHTAELAAIDGAVESLQILARTSSIILLTNLPHHARQQRIANMRAHGLEFPVVTNAGPKGPAIHHLARQTAGPVVFVDDSPGFIQSARQHAPDVHLIHFIQDARFERHVEHHPYVSLRTGRWEEALPHIQILIADK